MSVQVKGVIHIAPVYHRPERHLALLGPDINPVGIKDLVVDKKYRVQHVVVVFTEFNSKRFGIGTR